ncbi:MAG: DEAD/DEAH box helicase [Acidimicrobiales bacterium]
MGAPTALEAGHLHATILPGTPARATRLALWSDDRRTPVVARGPHERVDDVELVWPTARGVRRRTVRARTVEVGLVVDELVSISSSPVGGSPVSASLAAWAQISKIVLSLVARGRLQPAISPEGVDQWVITPLGEKDRALRAHLVESLPPAAHCLVVGEGPPVRMLSAERAVVAFYQAIADAFPRTPAAPLAIGQREWASAEPNDVTRLRSLLVGSDHAERTIVGLRLRLPDGEESAFSCDLQLRSAVDPTRVVDVADLWSGTVAWFETSSETDLLRALRRGSGVWPPLRRLLEQSEPQHLELADDEAMELFGAVATELAGAGIEVLVPTVLTRTLKAEAHVEPPPGAGDTPGAFDLASVCQLTWRATIDGTPVSDDELAALAAARRPLVKVRDEWVVVDPTVVAKLARRDRLTSADALSAALGGSVTVDDEVVDVVVHGPISRLADRLRQAARPDEIADPAGLVAELRPYQRRGVAWIQEMSALGFGGILADDMGLGKTIQVIALLLHRAEIGATTGPTLVVCPASVVSNWQREIERFAPSIRVRTYVGMERTLDDVAAGEVVVTTYGLARRDRESLATVGWGLVVADEAQHIKNPNSSTAKAMRQIPSTARLALTGTPVENRLTELWALLDWTTPGLLGSVDAFRRRVSIPIERDHDDEVTERFGRMIAPFLLRRRKDDPDIAPELPPKTETVHPVLLTPEQAGLYRATTDEILDRIQRTEGIARRGLVLKLLTALKQICNHPAHYLDQAAPLAGRSGKLEAFDELIGAICDAEDSTLVFTQYVAMGRLLTARLAELGIASEMLDGSVPLKRRTAMVDRFQAGEFPVFVISLKAGGTGLNLTRATHVVHYDRWWNPAVENQASDRAWRIGQDRPVQVHQLISEGTLEERIAAVLSQKQALADAVVGSGESWLATLGDDELAQLVQLGEDR